MSVTPRCLRALFAAVLLALPVSAVGGATSAQAVTCDPLAALPSSSGLGDYLLRDGFETGDFRRWSARVAEGDARAYVGTTRRVSGLCAGRLVVSSAWDSRANVWKQLPTGTRDVWLSGWFRVDKEGGWGSNVPTWRVFLGGQRIADVYRQNVTGALWLRTSDGLGRWNYRKLGRTVTLGTWHKVELHVYANWSGSDIDVAVDGTTVYHNGSHWLPVGRLDRAMIGAEHRRQVMDLWFDLTAIRTR